MLWEEKRRKKKNFYSMIKQEYIIKYGECIPTSWTLTQAEERFIKDKIKALFLQHVVTAGYINRVCW